VRVAVPRPLDRLGRRSCGDSCVQVPPCRSGASIPHLRPGRDRTCLPGLGHCCGCEGRRRSTGGVAVRPASGTVDPERTRECRGSGPPCGSQLGCAARSGPPGLSRHPTSCNGGAPHHEWGGNVSGCPGCVFCQRTARTRGSARGRLRWRGRRNGRSDQPNTPIVRPIGRPVDQTAPIGRILPGGQFRSTRTPRRTPCRAPTRRFGHSDRVLVELVRTSPRAAADRHLTRSRRRELSTTPEY